MGKVVSWRPVSSKERDRSIKFIEHVLSKEKEEAPTMTVNKFDRKKYVEHVLNKHTEE